MLAETLTDSWDFLSRCGLVLDGNATRNDAEWLLLLFANTARCEVGQAETMMWLVPDDVMDVTIWWDADTKRFYLGILGDLTENFTA